MLFLWEFKVKLKLFIIILLSSFHQNAGYTVLASQMFWGYDPQNPALVLKKTNVSEVSRLASMHVHPANVSLRNTTWIVQNHSERSKSGIQRIEESATHVCIRWEIQEVLRKVGRSLQCISHSSPRLCCATEKTCTNVWALLTLLLNKESRTQNVYGWAEVLFALLFQMHIDDRM